MKNGPVSIVGLFMLVSTVIFTSQVVQCQVDWKNSEEVDDVMILVSNYTYPEFKGRCYKCVFASDISVYMRQSPVCLFEWEG